MSVQLLTEQNLEFLMEHVWCLSVSYFVYLVSVDPDIGDIDGK